MSTEKMREEFEASFKAENGYAPLRNHYGDGSDYDSPYCNGAWWAWMASRKYLVVALPDPEMLFYDGGCHWLGDESVSAEDASRAKSYVDLLMLREAIESLGLKIKQ